MFEGIRIFSSRIVLFGAIALTGEVLAMAITGALAFLVWGLALVLPLGPPDLSGTIAETMALPGHFDTTGMVEALDYDTTRLVEALAWLGVRSAIAVMGVVLLYIFVVSPAVSAIVRGASIDASARIQRGQAATWAAALGVGFRKAFHILLAWISLVLFCLLGLVAWAAICVTAWGALCVTLGEQNLLLLICALLVGVAIMAYYVISASLVAQVIVLEGLGPLRALARSVRLTRDKTLLIIGVNLLLGIGGFLLRTLDFMTPWFGLGELWWVFGTLVLMTYARLFDVVWCAYYLRWSREHEARYAPVDPELLRFLHGG